ALYVVADRAVKIEDGRVAPRAALETAVVLPDEAAYAAWREQVLPRLREELVVSLDGARTWSQGGVSGVSVQLRGWRVYDPCTGDVIAARPPSADLPADAAACGEAPEEAPEAATVTDVAPAPAAPQLP